ncbi:MAG: hypothetical protein IJL20_15085 [Lachnospiraceae bacterium]|nr:hypothetical protein [Lachnospiraceae bacterium]
MIIDCSETEMYLSTSTGKEWSDPDAVFENLKSYDIVSFDVFDTLILRPFSVPADVFHLLGEQFGIMDFKNIRTWVEYDSRIKHNDRFGNMEVNLSDIWKNLEEDVGISAAAGIDAEISLEEKLCYANPFMKKLWDRLMAAGVPVIVTSDMYLRKSVIEQILCNNGFSGYKGLYLSNEYQKSKADGKLYKCVLKDHPGEKIIHIGDNRHSDGDMAVKSGIDIRLYPGIFQHIFDFRPFDMSAIIGSAYRAIVSATIYNGLNRFSMDYEYGYIYGGLFVLGYCNFIRKYCQTHNIDRILFLSRDGDTLKQAYDYLYPDDDTEYVYWSRKAATKLEAFFDKHDYFRRFIYHKLNQKYSLAKALKAMELESLVEELKDWPSIWEQTEKEKGVSEEVYKWHKKDFVNLQPDDELTEKNGYLLRRFIEAKWDKVLRIYSGQLKAAKDYYSRKTSGCKKVLAVDIGWAGSGAMTLRHLFKNEWQLGCEVIGMIAGTNTIYNFEPDASEPFLQSGELVAYLYSQSHNRDLLVRHDPNKDYNVFWELLLSSPTPKFEGFYPGNTHKNTDTYLTDLDISLRFGKYDSNQPGIKEIQKGILDFVKEYHSHFREFPYMFNISGRDAYAPMLVAASHREKYLKAVEKRFKLEINVD